MNNDDKSQAPDIPQAGYTPPPVAPGAQYAGAPNANNYNQSQTPPNIPKSSFAIEQLIIYLMTSLYNSILPW